ncbi:hypothetical protein AAC387_Pa03g0284 [Persea americana]
MATNHQLLSQGGDDASEDTPAQNNPPSNLLQWMELLVTEMMNVSDVDEAEDCASRALELLKTIASHEGVQTAEISRQKKNKLKEQIESLALEISKHKIAYQNEYEQKSKELQELKQSKAIQLEQLKRIEWNSLLLHIHLRNAVETESIPSLF